MHDPQALISTEQLAGSLSQPDLRLYDCTTYLEPTPAGSEDPYIAVSGRRTFEEAHIPGADFLDLQGEFSDHDDAAALHDAADGAARGGVRPARARRQLARRALQHRQHDVGDALLVDAARARLRSGGGPGWRLRQVEGRGQAHRKRPWQEVIAPTTFTANPRPGLFVGKEAVLAALGDKDTVIVNALGPQFHKGLEPSRYGRPGRVPGSVNVPAASLVDPATKAFTTLGDAEAKLNARGVTKDRDVICYCGGGISATIDLFLLHQLGYDRLALYDGSMGEWARDKALPIETD